MARSQEELTIHEVYEGFCQQKKKIIWIVVAGLILGILSSVCVFIHGEINKKYCATASIAINAKTSNGTYVAGEQTPTLSDITISKTLVTTAQFIAKSENIYLKIVDNLSGDFTYADYKKAVGLSQHDTTQIMILQVFYTDPQEAVLIANEIVKVLPEFLQESMDIGSVNAIDTPVSATPISNNSFVFLILIGFLAGVVTAFTWSIIDTMTHPMIMKSSDIGKQLHIEALSEIPHQDVREKQDFISVRKGKASASFMENYGVLAAIFKSIATKENAKCIMVTSSLEGEGKSTITINLAHAMTANGYRVLMIDCDTRKPVIGKALNLDKDKSRTLNQVMDHQMSLNASVIELESGLHVIQCVSTDELLLLPELNAQIHEMRQKYDYIFFDTPPVGVFSDALNLADCVDGCIFVIRQCYASSEFIDEMLNNLKKSGVRILGSVFNNVKHGKRRKADYSRRYYQKSYGANDSEMFVFEMEKEYVKK